MVAAAISEGGERQYYDRPKYVELTLDLAETILGVSRFDRRQLRMRKKPKDYIEELKLERSVRLSQNLRL